MEAEKTCFTCKWNNSTGREIDKGLCSFHPPVVLPNGETRFPEVQSNYYCSKHEVDGLVTATAHDHPNDGQTSYRFRTRPKDSPR